MRARLLISSSLLLALALLAAPRNRVAQEELLEEISTIEKTLWEAWKNKRVGPFHLHMAENSVSVSPDGVLAGKQVVIQTIENTDCEVKSYSFSDMAVHRVSNNAAILTYRAEQDAVCDGEKIPENVVVAAVYVRQYGRWLATSYQETPIGM